MSEQNGNGSGLTARWKGLELRTRGELVYITIIVAVGFGILGYMVSQLAENQKGILQAQEATTYVLTLSQEEREKLNLRMPDALREKLNR